LPIDVGVRQQNLQDVQNDRPAHPPNPGEFVSPTHPPIASQSITRDAPFHGRGRSKRGGESYRVPIALQNAMGEGYVESLSAAITRQAGTRLAGIFNILPSQCGRAAAHP
jgi:hypothetical protein